MLGACDDRLSVQQAARVDAWLHCEECVDGELNALVTLVGQEAVGVLRRSLEEPHTEQLPVLVATVAAEWERLQAPAVDSATFVDTFVENYRATVQKRAAVALGSLGDTVGLRLAMESPAYVGYRPDVQTAIEQARVDAGAPNFAPVGPFRVVVRPSPLTVPQGGAGVLEAVVLDPASNPRDVQVVWASADPAVASVTSPENGRADVIGQSQGTTTITASLPTGGTPTTTSVSVVAAAAPPSRTISIVSGDGQVDVVNTTLDNPLVVEVRDAVTALPVAGVTVLWQKTRGEPPGPVLAVQTNTQGRATLGGLMMGPDEGRVWVTATVAGAGTVLFRLYAGPL
jgi:hypothetical protein